MLKFQVDDVLIIIQELGDARYIAENLETKKKGLVYAHQITLHEAMPSRYSAVASLQQSESICSDSSGRNSDVPAVCETTRYATIDDSFDSPGPKTSTVVQRNALQDAIVGEIEQKMGLIHFNSNVSIQCYRSSRSSFT